MKVFLRKLEFKLLEVIFDRFNGDYYTLKNQIED